VWSKFELEVWGREYLCLSPSAGHRNFFKP